MTQCGAMRGTDITGVVLAGGRATRWGGRDKGLIEVAGRPMIAHVLDAFAPQVESLVISANRNLAEYRAFGVPVVTDAPVATTIIEASRASAASASQPRPASSSLLGRSGPAGERQLASGARKATSKPSGSFCRHLASVPGLGRGV